MKYYTSTTEFNCGIDLHARQMYVCVMDRAGKKVLHANIQGNDFGYFLERVEPYRHDMTVLAMTILFELDTVKRFPTVKDFLSYSPSTELNMIVWLTTVHRIQDGTGHSKTEKAEERKSV